MPVPYPGLASYGDADDDAELFFGRARERELVIANLRAARLTVLYGPSGIGKSSLLHAGVVHSLRMQARQQTGEQHDDEPRAGVVLLDDWTGEPTTQLVAKIQALTSDTGGVAGGAAMSLLEAVTAYRARCNGGLLIVLDQFEDYMRLHPDPHKEIFDEVFSQLVRDRGVSARVLVAIREDRLADLDRFAGRIPQMLGNVLRLGPLSPAAAREAIEGPIDRYNAWARDGRGGREVTLEPGLAEAVCDELVKLSGRHRADQAARAGGDVSGGQPYVETTFLQLVMRRLWDEEIASGNGTTIRLTTLIRLGGAAEIVASHLDAALSTLSAKDQALTSEMLRFLITPSGATTCLTALDLSEYVKRPQSEVQALAERLSRAPARILGGVAAVPGQAGGGGYELPQVLAGPALEWRARQRTMRLEERVRTLLLALVAMTAVAVGLLAYALKPGPLQRLELATIDARFDLRGARPADSRIAFVTLDDAAYARQLAGPQPPRATMARALDVIATAAPRAVAIDIIYTGRRPPAAADEALIKAIHGPLDTRLVLATDRFDTAGESQLFGRDEQTFDGPSAGPDPSAVPPRPLGPPAVGFAGLPMDPGGVARRIDRGVSLQHGTTKLDAFAVATAQVAGDVRLQQLPQTAWIDYRGGRGTFPRIAFYDVLRRQPEALAKLRGKIVVLGNTAKLVGDVHPTSAPGHSLMDGPEIQANAIATALDRFPLRDGGRTLDLALIIALGLLPLGFALRLRPANIAPAGALAAALFAAAAQLTFDGGRVIAVVFPLASLTLATIGLAAAQLLRGARARRTTDAPATAMPTSSSATRG